PEPPVGWAEVSAPRAPGAGYDAGGPAGATHPGATHGTSQEPGSGPDAPHGPPVPPSWDPLGAAPFAWDLPEPGVHIADEAQLTRKSRLTKITLGLALIAAAVAAGLSTIGGLAWLDATRIAAVALAVV